MSSTFFRPFIRFVAACTDRTLEKYLHYTTEILPKFPKTERQPAQVILNGNTQDDDE